MPNGHDKNWVRLCAAIDGFRVRFGHWPTNVRINPISLENIRDDLFTPNEYAQINTKVTLRGVDEEGKSFIAGDGSDRIYDYSTDGFPEQRPSPSAAEWLGVEPKH